MRRLISFISILVALVALALVLYNATLVDRRSPSVVQVSLSAPTDDDRIAQTITAIDIRFSEPVEQSTVEARFSIEPYVAGAFTWDGATAIFTPSSKLPGDTEFTVRIEAGFADLVGNVADLAIEPWIFRTVGPPVVVGAAPVDGIDGVAIDGVVDLEFDRLMDTASVEVAIRIDPPVTFRAAWSGEVVRLQFDPQLRFGTTYTLTVGVGAADTGGNGLREPFTLRFSTVAAALAVTEIVPANGASGVGIRTPVAIRFGAPIDPDTARAAFRIVPSVDGDVRIVSIADDLVPTDGLPPDPAAANTILFVPDHPLAPHTTYAVTLEPIVARRGDPASVAAGRSWTFTTGSPAVSGQNLVAFLSTRSGVRNLWLMNPDGTNPHQISTELVPVSGFDSTGDGSRVAYSAGGVVSVIGSDGENLVRLTAVDRFEYAPVFTPDDGHLIVARRGVDGSDLGYWLVPLPGVGGEERRLVDHGAPALGSAGLRGEGIGGTDGLPAWMARSAVDPTGRFAIVITAEGEVLAMEIGPEAADVAVRVPLVSESPAAWSPRHGAFILSAGTTGDGATAPSKPGLWVIGPDGTFRELEGLAGAVGPIGVTPDGSIAATIRTAAGRAAGIGLLRPGEDTPIRLQPAAGFDDRWPTFSPDGATLLIGRTSLERPADGNGIWALDLASGTARQLSTDGTYARWLP